MGKTYSTFEIAKAVNVHPNTVRLYEKWGYLPKIPRNKNGYRIFKNEHLEQMRLARIAFRCEFIQGNIRKKAANIVILGAQGKLKEALIFAEEYKKHVKKELKQAEKAAFIVQNLLNQESGNKTGPYMNRKEVAGNLGVSIDVLRNWELNGLISVPRNPQNGYRVYGKKEINRLIVIRTLREANYSLMAILRMLRHFDYGKPVSIKEALNTPGSGEEIVDATDKWISTLEQTERDALELIKHLEKMIKKI